jgi:membrane protease subunit (stomatin/prohibitin family)
MALWDKIMGQFIDVIEWVDPTKDTLVFKFPRGDNEIKNGAQLIVRESQAAVFLHEGQLGDVFGPGRHELKTANIPILTTLASWKYAFDAPFKCDIYFVSTRQFTDQKWGTQNPIMLRDPEFGPVRLRAFGSYCFQVGNAGAFIKQIAGTCPSFQTEDVNQQLRNILVARFSDALGEARIPMLDLASQYNELGEKMRGNLQTEFDEYGLKLTKFLIENVSLPPAVEEALDKRAQMGVLGDLGKYTQLQTANALGDMAKNPGAGGNMMGMIAGVGMGNVVGGAVAGSASAAGAPPPLPTAAWYAAIDGKQTGPLDLAAIQTQISTGRITRETLVWKQGLANWLPARDVPDLAALFGAVPPPLPK